MLNVRMSAEFSVGNHASLAVVDGVVHKTIRYDLHQSVANRLADNLGRYVESFDEEPLAVAPLHDIRVLPAGSGKRRLAYANQLCDGPNIASLQGEDLRHAVGRTLGQIASMSQIGSEGRLRVPLDASTGNFCLGNDGGVLVDVFPPFVRHEDGSLPFEDMPYAFSKRYQDAVEYRIGTAEGATLHMLFTAMRGMELRQQAFRAIRKADDWCYDVIPSGLNDSSKKVIRREIHGRFMPYLLRMGAACGIGRVSMSMGMEPYAPDSAPTKSA